MDSGAHFFDAITFLVQASLATLRIAGTLVDEYDVP